MINSVLKAIDMLSLFSQEEPRLSITEISQRLKMPKSTVHNLLQTLQSRGFVEKVDNDHYALGTALISLTQSVRVNVELRDRAAPLLRILADQSHESVYLTVLDGDHCLYIYAIETSRRLLARTAVGERVPLHCTSVGKAILAFLPDARVKEIVDRMGLARYTPATITTLDALRTELELTRQRGYAIDQGEHEPGIYCIGAPIVNEKGNVIGACSVSGADPEIVRSRVLELGALVIESADQISRRMGYVPATAALIASPSRSLALKV